MVVYTSVAWLLVFYDCGQKAPLPPLADRVVMGSGGGAKDVGTFGDQLIEVPPGPVVGEFDDHPACALDHRGRHLDNHAAPGARLSMA